VKKNTDYHQSMRSSAGFDFGVISVFRLKNGFREEEEAEFCSDKYFFLI
jgi:hypothetical protein